MDQFDVVSLGQTRGRTKPPELVVILQHGLSRGIGTTIVAPMLPEAAIPAVGRLRPVVSHAGKSYRVIVDRLNVVADSSLGEHRGNVASDAMALKRAFDELFFGV